MIQNVLFNENGTPVVVQWIQDDGTEMHSYLGYHETFNRQEERDCFIVWGKIFHLNKNEVELIDKRFFCKDVAIRFYKKIITKHPHSKIKLDSCLPIKKYH